MNKKNKTVFLLYKNILKLLLCLIKDVIFSIIYIHLKKQNKIFSLSKDVYIREISIEFLQCYHIKIIFVFITNLFLALFDYDNFEFRK